MRSQRGSPLDVAGKFWAGGERLDWRPRIVSTRHGERARDASLPHSTTIRRIVGARTRIITSICTLHQEDATYNHILTDFEVRPHRTPVYAAS